MLYLVSTPIGNLGEITFRAVEILKSVDYILCEDTRTSLTLLNNYEIKKPLYSYHKFNENSKVAEVISDLKSGKNIALISDAGMPGISDPGNILVNACIKENAEYSVISGPSAFVNAFVLSGFQPPFTFIGFLPSKSADINRALSSFQNVDSCLIFYMSPHEIDNFFVTINKFFPNRKKCVVREISKKFEEVSFLDLGEAYDGIKKGELVVVLDKPQKEGVSDSDIEKEILKLLKENGKNDVAKIVAKKYGISKSEIYKRVIEISGN